jgi:multidrug resistance efflux pump
LLFTVETDVGREVKAGDVLARLDTRELDSQLDVLRAERKMLEESVSAAKERAKLATISDVGDLKRRLAQAQEEQLRLNAESQVVRGERERLSKLVENKQATRDELYSVQAKEAALGPLAQAKPRAIGLLSEQINELSQRDKDGAVTQDLEAQVTLADAKLRELLRRRENSVVRAARDGRVVEVLRRQGEFADVGTPLLRLASHSDRVIACLPEGSGLRVAEGSEASVRPKGSTAAPLHAKVVARSPVVAELPAQCRSNPALVAWGQRVVLRMDEESAFVSGQALEIEFPLGPAAATQPATPARDNVITRLLVPAELSELSRLEPSGLTANPWAPGFLLVSDDTGLDGERLPLLFTMAEDGRVDATPVPIRGVEEVTDLESIAATQGKVYALASQSLSKGGKRPLARTLFLELEPQGGVVRASAQCSLYNELSRLAEASDARLTKLGLSASTLPQLDIEGMTAMPDGSLLLGLKAPLSDQAEAMIWRLGDPSALARCAGLEAARLEPFTRVALPIAGDAGSESGGLSELLLRRDGSLLIASTPSSGERSAGSLFVRAAPSEGPLTLVRTFPTRKPEALAQAADGGVLVLFDNGASPGEFLKLAAEFGR